MCMVARWPGAKIRDAGTGMHAKPGARGTASKLRSSDTPKVERRNATAMLEESRSRRLCRDGPPRKLPPPLLYHGALYSKPWAQLGLRDWRLHTRLVGHPLPRRRGVPTSRATTAAPTRAVVALLVPRAPPTRTHNPFQPFPIRDPAASRLTTVPLNPGGADELSHVRVRARQVHLATVYTVMSVHAVAVL